MMNKRINVKTTDKNVLVNATQDLSKYYSDLSRKWAADENIVDGRDYSSKHYANVSKASADEALQNVETAKNDALTELERDAEAYIKEAKGEAENAGMSALRAETTVNEGIETINAIIRSMPEKFAGFGLFDTKLTDHILTGQDAAGWALQGSLVTMTYPDAVDKVKELYENGIDTEYRGIICRRAIDGRYVADITQKELIDALFADTGVADFYVLDSGNSQFYLPLSNRFNQMTVDTGLVNTFNEAGLPNIVGSVSNIEFIGNTSAYSGAMYSGTDYRSSAGSSSGPTGHVCIDASRSNPVYGKSETVQPPSGNKLLYYKIGNTVINETQIDVGNVLSDLQTKADVNLTNTEPSQSFIEKCVGWNSPDWTSAIDISSLSKYTCPCDGYICTNVIASKGEGYVSFQSSVLPQNLLYYTSIYTPGGLQQVVQYKVTKAETLTKTQANSVLGIYFVPLKGVTF